MSTRPSRGELESTTALISAAAVETVAPPAAPVKPPPHARWRTRGRPSFVPSVLRLAACLAGEAMVNLAQLGLFLLRRRAVRRTARDCILQAPRASRARELLFRGSSMLVLLLASCLSSGCAAWNREWRQLEWSVVTLADQRGELRGLGRDLAEIFDPEPDQLLETIVMLGF